MLISIGNRFSCILITIWWLHQEHLFTGKSSFSVPSKRMSTAALAETETIQMREREEMEWNRCAVAQREQHTYTVRAHTTHKAKNTCKECRATRSSWSKTNQSIAGWLRSNHHSQTGHNERMADSLWRRSLSCSRLMGEILERFMRHQDEHANKNLDAIQHLLSDTKSFLVAIVKQLEMLLWTWQVRKMRKSTSSVSLPAIKSVSWGYLTARQYRWV